MTVFSFLHISDLHLAKNPKGVNPFVNYKAKISDISRVARLTTFDPDLLISLTRNVSKLADKIDFVLVTGDISTSGMIDDIRASYDHFRTVVSVDAKQTPPNVCLLPGNHDRFQDPQGTPGGKFFDSFYHEYWSPKAQVNVELYKKADDCLAVIAIDFSLQDGKHGEGVFGHWGQGKVYQGVIDQVKSLIEKLKAKLPNAAIIIAMHYEPFPTTGNMRLINADEFISLLKNYGIYHVFCGHTHSDLCYLDKNGLTVINSGTATSYRENQNTFNVTQVFVENNVISKIVIDPYKRTALKDDFYASHRVVLPPDKTI